MKIERIVLIVIILILAVLLIFDRCKEKKEIVRTQTITDTIKIQLPAERPFTKTPEPVIKYVEKKEYVPKEIIVNKITKEKDTIYQIKYLRDSSYVYRDSVSTRNYDLNVYVESPCKIDSLDVQVTPKLQQPIINNINILENRTKNSIYGGFGFFLGDLTEAMYSVGYSRNLNKHIGVGMEYGRTTKSKHSTFQGKLIIHF